MPIVSMTSSRVAPCLTAALAWKATQPSQRIATEMASAISSLVLASSVPASVAADASNTRWLAEHLFTGFILPFEFAAVILTVAVIAAVMLTLRRRTGNKSQNPGEQTRVKAGDRLRMVSMPAEKPAPATAPAAAEGEGQP